MDKLFLIGGTDSIGVPYTKDNKTNSGFFEQIENFLSNHFEVTTFNFFHMSTYNTNSFILECLKKNYSLAEIKVQQNQMLRKCKYSGVYPYLELPKNFLNFYKNDIEQFFTEVNAEHISADTAYIVCCDTALAGVLLGTKTEEGKLDIVIDYTTPFYSDCSVGKFLYSKLPENGIHELIYSGNSQNHKVYLQKMGFVNQNGRYIKNV